MPDTGTPPIANRVQSSRAQVLIARIERIPFSRWHIRPRVIMGSATFLDAFDALSLAFVLPVLIRLWHMTPVDIGWMIAASYVGQLVGALVFSRLAESWGRVPSVAAATAIMSVMSLGCALAGNFSGLFACRLIQGIGVGGEMPVAATYVSELSPARGRGRFFMLYEMIFPVGLMICGQLGTILVPMFGWQALFLVGAVPGIILSLLILRLPESPRWLIGRGRLGEAEIIIDRIEASARRQFPHLDLTTNVVVTRIAAPVVKRTERGRWMELLSPFYRTRTLIAWTLWACAFFVANGINNWMPTLYRTVYHLELRDALRAASMTNIAQVAVLLACAFVIDRIGRRTWTVTVFVVGAVMLGALAAGLASSLVAVMILATLAYGMIGSANAVLYLYTPEIYPTRMRALGTGLATSWLRIASAAGPPLVGLLVTNEGIHAVFLMFTGVALVGAVAGLMMIETRNRQLEDIAP